MESLVAREFLEHRQRQHPIAPVRDAARAALAPLAEHFERQGQDIEVGRIENGLKKLESPFGQQSQQDEASLHAIGVQLHRIARACRVLRIRPLNVTARTLFFKGMNAEASMFFGNPLIEVEVGLLVFSLLAAKIIACAGFGIGSDNRPVFGMAGDLILQVRRRGWLSWPMRSGKEELSPR
jgi:hypothetical protein